MKLSEMVTAARKKRATFKQVIRTIAAASTFAEAEEAGADLVAQQADVDRFIVEKQADRDTGFVDVKAPFREARDAFYAQEGSFQRYLGTVTRQLHAGSQERIRAYRAEYQARREALDAGLDRATALYQEFAPYLRNRDRLRGFWARLPLFERIVWMAAHALLLLAVLLKLGQSLSWSAFVQDDLLVFWSGLGLLSLIRWGSAWGLSSYFRRRDRVLFGILRARYKTFDLAGKQAALKQSLPPISLDLSVLDAPAPDETKGDDMPTP